MAECGDRGSTIAVARRALAIAQRHDDAGAAGAHPRRPRRRGRRRRGLSRSDREAADAGSVHADRDGGGRGAHRRCRDARREDCDLRRLRRRWRNLVGAAGAFSARCRARSDDPYPGPHLRGLRTECRSDPLAGRSRRDAARHGRLRHHQHRAARGGAAARPGCDRHRPSPGRRAPAPTRWWSIRTGSTISPSSGIWRRWASCFSPSSRSTACCASAASGTRRGRSPICSRCSIVVALGTVADVVPLKGLNRAFVSKGLIALRRRESPGLTALMDAARLSGPPEPWHLGFLLGPRINAGGRIGRADLGRAAADGRRSDRGCPHRRRARSPQPRAPGDRSWPCWRRPKPRRWPRSAWRRRARWWSPRRRTGIPAWSG